MKHSAQHYLDHLLPNAGVASRSHAGIGAEITDDVGVWSGAGVETGKRDRQRQALSDWNASYDLQVIHRQNIGSASLIDGSNLYILLYRSSFLQSPCDTTEADGQIALERASRSTRILEDMISHGLVQHGSLHL